MPAGPRFERLDDWLDWQQRLHPVTIDLGLERVARVLARTGWLRHGAPVITVGGTNGKGSVVAMLDALLRAGGFRVATFTSPHLLDYRERIRIDGEKVSPASLVAAFERIGDALGTDSLTFFEFNTLAALLVFETAAPEVVVLEVGLGGRLDAVNVVDADVAVVVSVGLDHVDWLGSDVEQIGFEKAGIFRPGRPAIFGSVSLPQSVVDHAAAIDARLLVQGKDFEGVERDESSWDFVVDRRTRLERLPRPALAGRVQVANAATALMALDGLPPALRPGRTAVEAGLRSVSLPGRFQRIPDPRGFEWVLDVAHNPAAAATLAGDLASTPAAGATIALCGMLGDKDVAGVVTALKGCVDRWLAVDAEGPRAVPSAELARRAAQAGITMEPAGPLADAMQRTAASARPGDRIVVFGSFHTVGPALAWLGVPL